MEIKNMKQLIKNLKAELKLRQEQLDKDGINIEHTKGQIYALRTAIIFAEEGVDGKTIVRYGK